MRVFRPLPSDHPIIGDKCAACGQLFFEGQRLTLVPVREPGDRVETVQAIALHATCSLRGKETVKGIIERIKDGDGSPFPVLTEQGQFTLEEVGLSD